MIEIRGFSIVRLSLISMALPRQSLSKSQLGSGRSRIELDRSCVCHSRSGELVGGEKSVTQIVGRSELVELLLHGVLQVRNRRRGIVRVEQRDGEVELRFVQTGTQLQSFPVFGDGLLVLVRHAV